MIQKQVNNNIRAYHNKFVIRDIMPFGNVRFRYNNLFSIIQYNVYLQHCLSFDFARLAIEHEEDKPRRGSNTTALNIKYVPVLDIYIYIYIINCTRYYFPELFRSQRIKLINYGFSNVAKSSVETSCLQFYFLNYKCFKCFVIVRNSIV